MAIETLAARTGATPLRIRRVQKITLTLLFIAGIVNFLDRSSLSVAGEAIRADLGLSATEFGVLLSAFSLSYGFAQLPSGILLDRLGPRIVLGAGLIFWSAMQALTGMVNSFSHFILLRIGLGIGEAPFMPAGVKSINDWYAQRERGTAVGIFNSSTVLGQAIAPPALVIMQLAWGWRTMFVVIGLAGIVVGLCWYVGYRNRRQFTLQEEEQQYLASEEAARPALKFSEWLALFKRRTTWGDDPRLFRCELHRLAVYRLVTRLFAGAAGVKPGPYRLGGGDPVSCRGGGDVGQRPGGRCPGAQRLRSGENPQNGDCYRSGAVGAGHLAGGAIVHASPGGGFYLHGAVLRSFCRDVRLGAGAGNGGGA